jgi:hypothetical protein
MPQFVDDFPTRVVDDFVVALLSERSTKDPKLLEGGNDALRGFALSAK